MDEELQKRNTDCVYFLASPLTCKKGIECEYRHSEIARLNPRDCWYWLAGSCLNPTCGFRHPPLDGHPEKSSESASQTVHVKKMDVPVKKTEVPCFFFFNGFCSKGYKCSFLHGHDDTTHTWKPSKTASVVSDGLLEKKISTGSDTGSTHIDANPNPNPSQTVPPIKAAAAAGDDSTQDKAEQELQQLARNNIEERSEMMMSASEEGDDEAERFIQRRSLICMDQSSDENVNGGGHIEREDWLESSPGFDVLVDDRLENIGYEQDPEYLLNNQSTVYDYEEEDTVGYNRRHQEDRRILYEQEIPSFGDLNDELIDDYIRKNPVCLRERMLNSVPGRKRKFLPAENGWRGVDLRDHLKKRRVVFDGHLSRKLGSARQISRSQQRHNIVGSCFENKALFKGKPRRPQINKSKEKRHRKQQLPSSQVSRKPISKKRKTKEETSVFTGPKSLNQIKEEKKRAEQNEEEDFQGPKPLSEILKDKRRLGLVTDGYDNSS